ncbi:hypothetical protein PMAYCL1PPCAC_16897, partial [Pristionchus mayeri]
LYANKCFNNKDIMSVLLNCLIYSSYASAFVVVILYLLIFRFLRKQRITMAIVYRQSRISIVEMQILKQSVFIFTLYAASIFSVLAISFVSFLPILDHFDIAYIENLLNLSIAAVYPICFLLMSGDMKRF